jgi:predicted AAA+ superfamily ATPase
MIPRRQADEVRDRLGAQAAVALFGPRQIGKTTLALQMAERYGGVYFDLENPTDAQKFEDPRLVLEGYRERLVVLDEIQRRPDLFAVLRGLIDEGRREGRAVGRFLLLGSSSLTLAKQSSETLAGRIAFLELTGIQPDEFSAPPSDPFQLWVRGGFPESLLASTERDSLRWRIEFIRTYIEREIPQYDSRIPSTHLTRLWTMLAHLQSTTINVQNLTRGLELSRPTILRYLDLLESLYLIRFLPPFFANVGKRLVKSPKFYLRDSGLVHALLNIPDREALLGHPVRGQSWEGFAVEAARNALPWPHEAFFYRTQGGAEVDLVINFVDGRKWMADIKLGDTPRLERGFFEARGDLNPERCFLVHGGRERYPLKDGVEAIPLIEFCQLLRST